MRRVRQQHVFASLLLFKHWECSLGRNGKETDDSKEEGVKECPLLPDSWEDGASIPSLLPALRGNVSFNDTLSPFFLSLLPHSLTFFFLSIYLCFSPPQFLRPNPVISRETCIKRKVTDREREREKRGTVIERK